MRFPKIRSRVHTLLTFSFLFQDARSDGKGKTATNASWVANTGPASWESSGSTSVSVTRAGEASSVTRT